MYMFVPDQTESGDAVVIIPLLNGDFLHITDHGAAFQQSGEFSTILAGLHIGS